MKHGGTNLTNEVKSMKSQRQTVEGLWVFGRIEGMLIRGYITKEGASGQHRVKVVEAEKPQYVGRTALVDYGEIKKVPEFITPQEAKELIDIALLIKDKEWFEELVKISNSTEGAEIQRWQYHSQINIDREYLEKL